MSLQLSQRWRRAIGAVVLAALTVLLSGCASVDKAQIRRLAMPNPSTKEADQVLTLWLWAWLAAIIIGVITWGLIFYAAIRFRRRSEREIPVQTRYNLPIEIFYTFAPVMVVLVFFFWTVKTQNQVQHDDPKAAQRVTVVGQQWSWSFNYNLGYDPPSNSYKAMGGQTVYEVGTTSQRPTLWLVKDKSVEIDLYSPDVVHSFWVPAFLYKQDVVPGLHNSFAITPTRSGTFQGRCAELCGVYHSRMLFDVKVVSQAQYDAHLADLAKRGNIGKAMGSSEIQRIPGLGTRNDAGGQ